MKKGYTHIVVVLDRSGSMDSIKTDTIGGFNSFLQEQKEQEGEATLSLAIFDNVYEVIHNKVNIESVEPLTEKTFVPRGSTALHDAICRTIDETGRSLASLPEQDRPEKVVCVIITDGGENASREFRSTDVNDRIQHQREKYGWEFVFLAANQDAMQTATHYSIPKANAMTYGTNAVAVRSVFGGMSAKLKSYREGGVVDMAYTEEERKQQEEVN